VKQIGGGIKYSTSLISILRPALPPNPHEHPNETKANKEGNREDEASAPILPNQMKRIYYFDRCLHDAEYRNSKKQPS